MTEKIVRIVSGDIRSGNYGFIHTALTDAENDARRNDQRIDASSAAWRYKYNRERQQDWEITEMVRRINEAREKREEEANT